MEQASEEAEKPESAQEAEEVEVRGTIEGARWKSCLARGGSYFISLYPSAGLSAKVPIKNMEYYMIFRQMDETGKDHSE